MERLTNSIDYCQMHCDFGKETDCMFSDKSKCYENNLYNRLREYEIAKEKGLLLRLPCKVGDTVYTIPVRGKKEISIDKIRDVEYRGLKYAEGQRFFINACATAYTESDIGKYLFLTKEEAEKALADMKGE